MIMNPARPKCCFPLLSTQLKNQSLQYTATDLPVAISSTHIKRVAWIQEHDKALEGTVN